MVLRFGETRAFEARKGLVIGAGKGNGLKGDLEFRRLDEELVRFGMHFCVSKVFFSFQIWGLEEFD